MKGLKISNNWSPYFARLFEYEHLAHRGFFRQKHVPAMDRLKAEFWAWHRKNPHVYELFKKFTFQVMEAGHGHYSARAIVHRIRWHTDIETSTRRARWRT